MVRPRSKGDVIKHFPKSHESCGNCACDLSVLGLFGCGACEPLPFWEHGCTVGIDHDPPVRPSTQAEWWRLPERQLLLWICGVDC